MTDQVLKNAVRPVLDALHQITASHFICFAASLWIDTAKGVAEAVLGYYRLIKQGSISDATSTTQSPSFIQCSDT